VAQRVASAVFLACVLFGCATRAWAACEGMPGRSGAITIEVGGVTRMFVVRVPSSADGRAPAAVLFAFHPFGMNAQYMQSRVSSRVWPEAIMLYPEGLSRGGGPSWQGRPGDLGDRDVQFFDAMLAWLAEHHCIDPKRVFVLGYSNGAALANVLACERRSAIAGVALAAGRPVCHPKEPLPAILGHGMRDQTAAYSQAVEASRAWATLNRCTAPPRAGAAGCFAAGSCGAAPVTLCTHAGGHEYSATFTREAVEFLRQLDHDDADVVGRPVEHA
jgi:polyhydroxybutyrate depolymerase